jgi:acyl carrier protein
MAPLTPTGARMSVRDDVNGFLLNDLATRHGLSSIESDQDLIRTGVIDSLGIQELIAFLESRFGISVGDEDLVPSNFQTVARIEAFIEEKSHAP